MSKVDDYSKYITSEHFNMKIMLEVGNSIGKVRLKEYDGGVIIDPLDFDVKCGFGSTIEEAIQSLKERNGLG